jgi:hypothetical protein
MKKWQEGILLFGLPGLALCTAMTINFVESRMNDMLWIPIGGAIAGLLLGYVTYMEYA